MIDFDMPITVNITLFLTKLVNINDASIITL